MHQVNEPPRVTSIAGFLLPWRMDIEQPVILTLDGADFVPVFSTEDKLHTAMGLCGIDHYRVKQIEDHAEFLVSVAGSVRVMADPWATERGTTRFTEIVAERR